MVSKQPAGRQEADHHTGRHELRAEPGNDGEQAEAAERRPKRRALPEPQRQQRRPGQGGAGGELGVHGHAVGQERRRQPRRQCGAERPRVRRDPPRQQVRQRDGSRGDRRHEQLHRPGAPERERRRDQQRETGTVRLVQPPARERPVPVQLVGVEGLVLARVVVIEHVDVTVLDERVRRQQVVRLVAGVVGVPERVKAQRGGVGSEQDDPEQRSPLPHCRAITSSSCGAVRDPNSFVRAANKFSEGRGPSEGSRRPRVAPAAGVPRELRPPAPAR